MKRRNLTLILLLNLVVLAPVASVTASAAEKTVGVIMTGNIPYYRDVHKAFTEGLAAEGLGPGAVTVVVQTPAPESMAWTNAARKLVAVGADIIISYGAPATIAVISETSDIPVVFAGVFDPQAVGVMKANSTGISSKVPVASLLKSLKSIANFSNLGIVFSDSEKDTVAQANEVKQLEGSFNFRSVRFNIKKATDTPKIANVDALFLTTGCSAMQCVSNILGVARKSKIPTATTIGGGEASGVLLTISANPAEQGREAAKMAARVIRGAKPSALPLEHPRKIDLTINLKEANEMGFKVPFDLLTAATRVIK
ncbi:MAG: ABC transporter substrate-binding protein [Nitrospiraceae bacterium]|nr:ABC transporter substrate-binding protein [Nitrospiraceae bacterium]